MLPMMAVTMPIREDHSRSLEPVSLSLKTNRRLSHIGDCLCRPDSVGRASRRQRSLLPQRRSKTISAVGVRSVSPDVGKHSKQYEPLGYVSLGEAERLPNAYNYSHTPTSACLCPRKQNRFYPKIYRKYGPAFLGTGRIR